MSTPNLGLENVPSNSLQPSVAINDAFQLLDALVQLAVVDKDVAAPPTTVAGDIGKRWIVAASPTGAWVGHATHIALCTAADQWRFIVPKDGFEAVVIDENAKYRFMSGAWTIIA